MLDPFGNGIRVVVDHREGRVEPLEVRRVDAESLDELIPQPTAPWQPEREWLSIRAMIIHLIRETAHHCGHADIIREALDGQTTMGAISEGQEWAEQWADADWAK